MNKDHQPRLKIKENKQEEEKGREQQTFEHKQQKEVEKQNIKQKDT